MASEKLFLRILSALVKRSWNSGHSDVGHSELFLYITDSQTDELIAPCIVAL